MKRKLVVAGNWKMNTNLREGKALAKAISKKLNQSEVQVILAPPFVALEAINQIIKPIKNLNLAAQNCHEAEKGAYTGEISINMLKSVGAKYVILGHSERRGYFGETDKLLAKKVNQVLANKVRPIFCCGESLEIRKTKKHKSFVSAQIRKGLFHLEEKEFSKVIIAYEPIWAIGTGVTATPEEAQAMHAHIRKLIAKKYGDRIAGKTTLLYGGSVKPTNAKELFSQNDVDGGLVGGASLSA